MTTVTVLIPTYNRPAALVATLVSVTAQVYRDFSVVIANQGDRPALEASAPFSSTRRLLELHGNAVTLLNNLPRRGMAQQRQFLLEHVRSPYCLFLDDDVLLEPFVFGNLLSVLQAHGCGFAGCGLIGLSFRHDYRPAEEDIELWEAPIVPEQVLPHGPAWQRYKLHNAANVLHVQERLGLSPENPRAYKVAWVGGCVLYDTAKLRDVGGFKFWRDLPVEHSGEDVLVQLRLMKRFGGCGVLPSGAYHQELPTTIHERKVNAAECLAI